MRCYGPLDLISTAQIKRGLQPAAMVTGEEKSAAARLGGSPETRDHAFPGMIHDEIKPGRLSTTWGTVIAVF
jgi:hypothetical protein